MLSTVFNGIEPKVSHGVNNRMDHYLFTKVQGKPRPDFSRLQGLCEKNDLFRMYGRSSPVSK